MTDDPVTVLRRWAGSGAIWRVLSRRGGRVIVGLYECTGGAEVDRIESGDPALLDYIGDRSGSED
ncbi:hypothetical protein [Nocardia terpenica]|uniref:Uncharacterized protein n=1 Tax=Nocardia terpenica TaxID=455432 RepID=A0A6G9Z3K3_9NOCA|nr:hypothetical protein [Nocardia terpenica]QIS20062.1 hypothetical protein F6W96_18950 [Nocardia terpenica]